jgi:hypothetical protein
MKKSWLVSGVALLVGLAAGAAHAEPKQIGSFGEWEAVTFEEDGKLGCYVFNQPSKMEGKYKVRGDPNVTVTHRPALQSLNVVAFDAGYTFKSGSDVTVKIGKDSFTLFTDKGYAWAEDTDTDSKLVQAMRKGNSMVVEGVSSRGTKTKDTYSLEGFSRAFVAINEACGVDQPTG